METKRLHLSKNGALDVEFVESETLERYDALAREALDECRKALMMSMRFLNAALWQLPLERAPLAHPFATNGRILRFDPERVIERYKADDGELVRDYLHTILHCIFHQPFDARHPEYAAWSLASDIVVELCAIELCGERFPSPMDEERLDAAQRLASVSRNTTAPALYQVLRSGEAGEIIYRSHGLTDRDLVSLGELFKRDAHELWAVHPRESEPPRQNEPAFETLPDLQGMQSDAPTLKPPQAQSAEPGGSNEPDRPNPTTKRETPAPPENDKPQPPEFEDEPMPDWDKISKQVETELRAHQHSLSGNGSLLQSLVIANRKAPNYEEFLKQFATLAEDIRINDEEFDYVFYTFGLNRYGNMPRVEPLEYRESKRVREFAIALDTSGSCSGELIRAFVERTYAILRQRTSFGDEINVHIIQCDNRVRTATKVTSLAQLESYSSSFWVSGGGGTDFKPVFEYVDELIESGEFNDLRGLIYFTDGYGAFPVKAPSYDVAFVFVDNEALNVKIPAWAMKVIMTQEEILQR